MTSHYSLSPDSFDYNYAVWLVSNYGEDSLAYLTLEEDKSIFFGSGVQGLIAYVKIRKVALCLGHPVCEPNRLKDLLTEFKTFCTARGLKICFCSINRELALQLLDCGFRLSKYGEEALLHLQTYEISGKKTMKLRQKIRRAQKGGINVIEYRPAHSRNLSLEEEILSVSREWLGNKRGKLKFTLGDLNFNNPLARRYFACTNENARVEAVLTFLPYAGGRGYYLDVMRKREETIPGVIEKAIIDAAMIMKDEGVERLSLGMAPLAGIGRDGEEQNLLEKSMRLIYSYMSDGYGFKNLHNYKKKFSPCSWESRYLAHEESLPLLIVAYTMIKARNSRVIWKQVLYGVWKKAGIKIRRFL